MNEEFSSGPTPRGKVPGESAGCRPAQQRQDRPVILTAKNDSSPPAPAAVLRSLVATKSWAGIDAFAFIIFGVLAAVQSVHQLQEWRRIVELPGMKLSTWMILARGELYFQIALAAGCLFAAIKLFHYCRAIRRLSQTGRMRELENALRHQRTVWMALGIAGAMWLLLAGSHLARFLYSLREFEEATETANRPPH